MTRDGYLGLLRQALSSPNGIALELGDYGMAEWARGRLYRLRRILRRTGDTSFDSLSLVMQPNGDLWIIRRDRLPRRNMEDGLSAETRPIDRDELPAKFGYCNTAFAVSTPKVSSLK